MKIKIYTDGACSGNPGKGGWAAIILDDNLNQTRFLEARIEQLTIEWN